MTIILPLKTNINTIRYTNFTKRARLILSTLLVTILLSNVLFAQDCVVNTGNPYVVCSGSSFVLQGDKGGNYASGNLSVWSQVSGPSVTILNASSNTAPNQPGIEHPATVIGFVPGQTYVFKLTGYCANGVNAQQDITFATVGGITIANAGTDFTMCNNTTAVLNGNTPLLANERGQWTGSGGGISVTSGATLPLATVTSNNAGGGTANLTWTITNTLTGCSSADIVVGTNRGGASLISAGTNQTISGCYSSTTSLQLNASQGGIGSPTQFGTWSAVNGPNVPNFGNVNTRNTTVSNLIQGTYQLRWTVQGSCVNGSADVFITVPAPTQSVTTAQNVAGSTTTFCDARTSAVIAGTVPTYANERNVWTVTGGATVVNPNSSTISITGLNSATTYTTRYYIINTLTGCSSNTITGTINYATSAPIVTLSVPTTVLGCGSTAVNLPYSVNISNVANTYSVISGPLTSISGTAGGSTVNLTGLNLPGTYIVRVQSRANGIGSCPVGFADASVTTSVNPTVSNPGSQSSVACTATGGSLVGNVPTSGTGTWSQISGPNTANLVQFNVNTATVTGLINGAYTFRWLISGGPGCTSSYEDVTIKVANTVPGTAFAGLDQAVCNLTPIFLQANTPRDFETGTWSVTPTVPAANMAPNLNSPFLSVTGLTPNINYVFRWTVSNSCNSGFSEANVIVSTIAGPAQALAGPDICRIGAFTTATLSGNNPSPAGATGLWTQLSGPTTAVFSNTTIGGPVLSGLTNGTYYFQWQLDRGGCNPTRDTVGVTIALASVAGANAGSDVSLCGNTTTLIGNNVSSVTGTWSLVNGNGGTTIASANAFRTTVTGLSTGTYTFRWTLANGVCPSSFDDVDIDVSAAPTTPNAGTDVTVCGANVITLSGNTITSGTGYWSVVGSAPGIATFSSNTSPRPTVSGLSGGTYNFRWTSTGGPFCSSLTDDVVVNVSTNANAGADQVLCNAPSLALNGNITGVWSQISGPTIAIIATVSGTSINVSNLSFGGYDFQFTGFGKFGCPNTTDNVIVSISGYGSTPSAGSDQFLCNNTITALSGNLPANGIGSWSITSGTSGASILGANLPNATIVGMRPGVVGTTLSGVYLLSWNVANGSCGNYQDEVRITTYATPTVAVAGANQVNACSINTTLTANNALVGVGTWTTVSGTNTIPVITNPLQSVTGVTNLSLGGYTFRWTISNGTCPATFDDVLVTVTGMNPDLAVAGPNQGLCNVTSTTLSGSNVIIGTNATWARISGPNTPTLSSSVTGLITLTGLTIGNYVYQYTTFYNTCISQSNVTITNSALPGVASITSTNFSVCPFVIPTVSGNNPSPGTRSWSYVSGPSSSPVFVNPSSSVTGINGLTPGNYSVNYNITNGFCPSSTANAVFTILGNCAPIAVNLTFTGLEDQLLGGTITGFSDPESTIPTITGGVFASVINAFPLTLTSSISTTPGVGRVQYQPGSNYFGTDTYSYSICDNGPLCTNGTLTFIIQPVNDPPVVTNMTISGAAGSLLTNNLTLHQINSTVPGSIYDVDNSTLTLLGLVLTSSGNLLGTTTSNQRVTISGNGAIRYFSNTTFSGVDSFVLRVTDGLLTTTGTIFFNISVSGALPIPQNDSNSGNENTTIVGNVLTNDVNPLTGTSTGLTVSGVGTSPIGSLAVNTLTGAYSFIPTINIPSGVQSTTSVNMNICNINGCVASTLTITVIGVNDPPTAINLTFTGLEDTAIPTSIIGWSDPDGDVLTVSITGLPSNGTLSGSAFNRIYTPNLNYNGLDSYTYLVRDPGGLTSSIRTVTISITGVNDPPVVTNSTISGSAGVVLSGNLTLFQNNAAVAGAIFDVDNSGLTLNSSLVLTSTGNLIGTTASNQAITISGNGAVRYLSNTTFSGLDSFILRASDGLSTTTGTIFFNISLSAALPIPQNDSNSGNENTTIIGNVLTNDVNPLTGTNSGLTVTGIGTNTIGTLALNSLTGVYSFIPTINIASGVRSITSINMNICNINGCVASSLTITVIGVNDPPTAINLTFTGLEDTAIPTSITGWFDIDGDPLTVSITGFASNGSISGSGFNQVYTPNANYNGLDTYTYLVTDPGGLTSSIRTVTISITGVNDPPTAINLTFTGLEDTAIPTSITGWFDVDGDPLSVSITGFTSNGSISGSGFNQVYTPNTNYNGLDTYTYLVRDPGGLTSSIRTVTVSITGVNDPPVVTNSTISGNAGVLLSGTLTLFQNNAAVAGAIFDVDNSSLTLNSSLVLTSTGSLIGTTTSNQRVTISGNGAIRYFSNTTFSGVDSFVFRVTDGLLTTTGTIFFNISVSGALPIPQNDTNSGNENTTIVGNVLTNDVNPLTGTNSGLTVTGIGTSSIGTLALNSLTGAYSFIPTINIASGVRSITSINMNICNINGCVASSLTITVIGVNDPPTAINLTFTGLEDTAIPTSITGWFDIDGDPLTVSITGFASNGSISGSGFNQVYTPNANYNGLDTYTYLVTDPGGLTSNIRTVTISITGVNDPPVVTNSTISGNAGVVLSGNLTLFQNNAAVAGAIFDVDNNSLTLNSSLVLTSTGNLIGTTASNQAITISGNGAVRYLSNTTFTGLDSFTLRASDGLSTTTGTIFFNISLSAALPIPQNDSNSGNENTTIIGNVLTNDVNPLTGTNSGLTVTGIGTSTIGTLTLNSLTGAYSFIPTINIASGVRSITSINMNICNINGCVASSLTITVIGVNDPPTAINLTFTGLEDTTIPTSITGWFDIDGDPLTVSITGFASNGSISGSGFNQVYTPNANYNGLDTYTYLVTDPGGLTSSIRTVTISITGVNDPPTAINNTLTGVTEDNLYCSTILGYADVDDIPVVTAGIFTIAGTGVITINGNGSFCLNPEPNVNGGPNLIPFEVCDPLVCVTANLVFNIISVNDPPTAINLTFTGLEDTTIPTSITGWFDVDGDPLTVSITGFTSNGSISGSGFNQMYTPNANYNGIDTYTYLVSDPGGLTSSIRTVTISITGVNDPPVAINLGFSGLEDNAIPTSIIGWSDVDGDIVTVSITGFPSNGSVSGTGFDLSYIPNLNYNGLDAYTYLVYDSGNLTSNIATVSITVIGVPDLINASNDSTTTNEDTPVTLSVLSNDFNSLTGSASGLTTTGFVGTISGGNVTITGAGLLTFVPSTNFNGIATYQYQVCNLDVCTTASAIITVTGINDPPVVVNNTIIGVTEDTQYCGSITGYADVDNSPSVTAGIFTISGVGVVTINGNGSFCLDPEPNIDGGPKLIPFEVCDPFACVTANLVFTISGVNDPPVAVDNFRSVLQNGTVTSAITGFSDVDNLLSDLTISTVTGGLPKRGKISLNSDGTFVYVPNPDVLGMDTIAFQVCDNETPSLCAGSKLVISIIPLDPIRPTIKITSVSGFEDIPQNLKLKDYVAFDQNDTIRFTNNSNPFHGTITGFNTRDGSFVYTPDLNYNGRDSITYEVCATRNFVSSCTSGMLIIIVKPVNDPPVAVRDTMKLLVRQTDALGNALSNDTDVDGDILIAVAQINTRTLNGGLFSISVNGVYTYSKPTSDFAGKDSVMYVITDPSGAKDTAYVVFDIPTSPTETLKKYFISEGFSPNGDGNNDEWKIRAPENSTKISVIVYNRWGNIVYKSDDYKNDWDGKANQGLKIGEGVPDGTYFYLVDFNNGDKPEPNFITITR